MKEECIFYDLTIDTTHKNDKFSYSSKLEPL